MIRYVFCSFDYAEDLNRVQYVNERWAASSENLFSGVVEKTTFDQLERQGEEALERWVDHQMCGTSVTVVFLSERTLQRPYVRYAIRQSIERGNVIMGVYIDKLRDERGNRTEPCDYHALIGQNEQGADVFFEEVADGIFDYVVQISYSDMNRWLESSFVYHRLKKWRRRRKAI